jgi:hypothetical protein
MTDHAKKEPSLADIMMTTQPPDSNIAEAVKQLTDEQLISWTAVVRELCGGDPPPSPIVSAARTFNRYWHKYRAAP